MIRDNVCNMCRDAFMGWMYVGMSVHALVFAMFNFVVLEARQAWIIVKYIQTLYEYNNGYY